MNNNKFIIALIISLLVHFRIINTISNLPYWWQYQVEKKETIIFARMESVTSDSFSQYNLKEHSPNNLNESPTSSEPVSKDKEKIASFKPQAENNKLIPNKDTSNIQDKDKPEKLDDRLLSKNNNKESIVTKRKIEANKEKKHTIENNKQHPGLENYQEENGVILGQINSTSQEVTEINSVSKDLPIDLTNPKLADSKITFPKIISYHLPEYPNNLRKRDIEGRVQLKVLINKKGQVREVIIDTSSGYQAFDQSARESIFNWKFTPAKYNGDEKESWLLIPVVFQLK